jgi:hypothetical protein
MNFDSLLLLQKIQRINDNSGWRGQGKKVLYFSEFWCVRQSLWVCIPRQSLGTRVNEGCTPYTVTDGSYSIPAADAIRSNKNIPCLLPYSVIL